MNLVASRNRDLPDIRMLAEEIGLTDTKNLADLVLAQYGDQLDALHGGYDDMLLWCRTLARTFWQK